MRAWLVIGAAAFAAYALRPRRVRVSPRVLVFGDSQAGGAGRGVAEWVRERGGTARVVSHPGERTARLARRLENMEVQPGTTVVWFTGGNDRPGGAAEPARAAAARLASRGAELVVVLPFPPTRIGDAGYGRRIWGQIEGPDHFLRTGYAQRMAQVRAELAATGLRVVDPTEVFRTPHYVSEPRPGYPLQRDGLHVSPIDGQRLADQALELKP